MPEIIEDGLTGYIVEDINGAIGAVDRLNQLSREKIRELLCDQREVFFNASKHSGWYSADFPQGVGELLFQARGEIKNLARLKRLYELFGETLDTLCQIGSATHDKTGVII